MTELKTTLIDILHKLRYGNAADSVSDGELVEAADAIVAKYFAPDEPHSPITADAKAACRAAPPDDAGGTMRTVWRQVETLGELLAFAAQHGAPVWNGTPEKPKGVKLPADVGKSKTALVVFADGAEMACVSAIEQTGYCDTCANEEAWTGFFVKDVALAAQAKP